MRYYIGKEKNEMTTATRTAETEKAIITIKLTREVIDDVHYMDGYNISAGREVYENYEVKITHKASGKTIKARGKPGGFAFFKKADQFGKMPAGAYARIGDAYITEEIYDIAMSMIAELDAEIAKSDEQVAIEIASAEIKRQAEANQSRIEAEYSERRNNSGWCSRCNDWTYGDCGHN
jgi:hypothetical protein